VQALAAARKSEAALAAAREAMGALESGAVRAWACEFVAGAARRRKDREAVLGARREAFRSAPTIVRLSALCSATTADRVSKLAAEDVVLVRERWSKAKREAGAGFVGDGLVGEGRRLLALLYLLAGPGGLRRPREAAADRQRHQRRHHRLLVAGCGKEPPAGARSRRAGPNWPSPSRRTSLRAGGGLEVHRRKTSRNRASRSLTPGGRMARVRARRGCSNRARRPRPRRASMNKTNCYERAARLWSAVHDAHVLAGRASEGARLFAEVRDRFSRSYRFRERLDEAARRSAAALARSAGHPVRSVI
jgi:hypothetical protein